MERLSERLSFILAKRRARVSELARQLGTSKARISRYKTGERECSDPELLFRMAAQLQCSFLWLSTGRGSPYPGFLESLERFDDVYAERSQAIRFFRSCHTDEATVHTVREWVGSPFDTWGADQWYRGLLDIHAQGQGVKLSEVHLLASSGVFTAVTENAEDDAFGNRRTQSEVPVSAVKVTAPTTTTKKKKAAQG